MILHHISNNAKFIEISTPSLRTKRFLERDLHIGNMLPSPRCAEKSIGKTQNEEILDHFFPEVMIDAEGLPHAKLALEGRGAQGGGNLIFTPDWGEGFLEGPGGFEVFAKGFFDLSGSADVHQRCVGEGRLVWRCPFQDRHFSSILARRV